MAPSTAGKPSDVATGPHATRVPPPEQFPRFAAVSVRYDKPGAYFVEHLKASTETFQVIGTEGAREVFPKHPPAGYSIWRVQENKVALSRAFQGGREIRMQQRR